MAPSNNASSVSWAPNSFSAQRTLKIGNGAYTAFSLKSAEKNGLSGISSLPYSLKILLENLLRNEDGNIVTRQDIISVSKQVKPRRSRRKIPFFPDKVLLSEIKDFQTVIELINARDKQALKEHQKETCSRPISCRLLIEQTASFPALDKAARSSESKERQFASKFERYRIIKWASKNLENFQAIPPGYATGQHLNLETLAGIINTGKPFNSESALEMVHPETFISSSNSGDFLGALSLLGWTEGTAATKILAFGEPIYVDIPEVIGIKVSGKLGLKASVTDAALGILSALSKRKAEGKIVEFYGSAISQLSIEDRATISSFVQNSGALCGFFPIDDHTISYIRATRGSTTYAEILETYSKHQGLFRSKASPDPTFSSKFEFDLASVEPSILGPNCSKKIHTPAAASNIFEATENANTVKIGKRRERYSHKSREKSLGDGDIVIAAISASGNTANPSLMIGSGLLAKKAVKLGLRVNPNVQTLFLTGSSVTSLYLKKSGLLKYLSQLGFSDLGPLSLPLSGNASPLSPEISKMILKNDIEVVGVHSGQPTSVDFLDQTVKTNFSTSPMLVIAYSICGTINTNILADPIGTDRRGKAIYLDDIWPSKAEIQSTVSRAIKGKYFRTCYEGLFEGNDSWRKIELPKSSSNLLAKNSKLVSNILPSRDNKVDNSNSRSLDQARLIGFLGHNVSPESILPSGRISPESKTGEFLRSLRVGKNDLGSYQDWASNAQAIAQDVFSFTDLTNPKVFVGMEKPSKRKKTILEYASSNSKHPLILMAGKNFGAGPQNDYAAYILRLIGVQAVIAESFDEKCLQSLICEGLWPLELISKSGIRGLNLSGDEKISVPKFEKMSSTSLQFRAVISLVKGKKRYVTLKIANVTRRERLYLVSGGLIPFVNRNDEPQVKG